MNATWNTTAVVPSDRMARAATWIWAAVLVAACIHSVVQPVRGTVYPTYAHAGEEFMAGRRLYDTAHPYTDNYRYSPLVAALFAPLSLLPLGAGGAIWRGISAAVFLIGLAAWGRRLMPSVRLSSLFLFAVPLTVGSLFNGQANLIVVGMMLWAAALAVDARWTLAAILVALATLFKGYPIALGLLFCLAAPIRCGVPLTAAVALGFALPFVLQSPDYIAEQYRFWAANLGSDDRTARPLWSGLQDFHMLLRVVGVQLSLASYRFIQAGAGAVAAIIVGLQIVRGMDRRQVILNAFTLGLCWMAVFGPAVEYTTYILLAPIMAHQLCERGSRPRWSKICTLVATAMFLTVIVALAFPHHIHQPVISTGLLPLGGVLLAAAAIGQVLGSRPGQTVNSDIKSRRAA